MRRWRQWRALSPDQRRLLVRAVAALAAVWWQLNGTRFGIDRDSSRAHASVLGPEARLRRARAIAWAVGVAAGRLPVRCTCLHRATALWRLLRAEGIACDLRLGVNAAAAPFAAHAWVECDGAPIAEAEDLPLAFRAFAQPVVPGAARRTSPSPR